MTVRGESVIFKASKKDILKIKMVLKPTFEKEVHPEIEVSLLARSLSQDLPPIFENIKDAASVSGKARSLDDLVNEEHFEDLSLVESISSTRKSESNLSECSFNFDSDLCESLSPVEEQPECGKVLFLNLLIFHSDVKVVLTSSGAEDCSLFNRALQMMPSEPACLVKVLIGISIIFVVIIIIIIIVIVIVINLTSVLENEA